MKQFVVVLLTATVLLGCQTAPQASSEQVLDNHTFMSLWSTYQHCMAGSNLEQLRADMRTLTNAPQSRTSPTDFKLPLPEVLLRYMSTQPTRTAADPKAMLAACSLHTAEVAWENGKNEVAAELLNGLLRTHASGEYAYYIQQAKANLHRMQPTAVQVSRPGWTGPAHSQASPLASAASLRPSPTDPSDTPQYE